MIRLLTIALLSTGCVIKVVSPTPIPMEDYQNVYVEPNPEPVIIRQVIIKKENKRVIIKHPRRPPRYKQPPKVRRPPPKLRKPKRKKGEKKKRHQLDKKRHQSKKKRHQLKKGQKMSSPTESE